MERDQALAQEIAGLCKGYVRGKRGLALCVGVLREGRGEIFGYGADGATVFEIGSITKVFTALLLAQMAEAGEVALHDPLAIYLPITAGRAAGELTLWHLATHTSGLPEWPLAGLDMLWKAKRNSEADTWAELRAGWRR